MMIDKAINLEDKRILPSLDLESTLSPNRRKGFGDLAQFTQRILCRCGSRD